MPPSKTADWLEGLDAEIDAAIDYQSRPKGGQSVGPTGHFRQVPMSTLQHLKWWTRELRTQLEKDLSQSAEQRYVDAFENMEKAHNAAKKEAHEYYTLWHNAVSAQMELKKVIARLEAQVRKRGGTQK